MKEIRSKGPRGESVRLGWDPGTMQVDFGQADFDYARRRQGKDALLADVLPVLQPRGVRGFADEKDVCVCQGLKDCFEHIGGVPPVIVLDNATEAGRRWRDVIVESDLFRRLRLHYGFTARFCNPNAGKEKGNVEGKVGYTRRNFFVPVPEVDDLQDYNRGLAETLDAHSEEQLHYEKDSAGPPSSRLDKARLLPLPKSPSTSSSGRRARPTATEGSPWTAAIATWRHPSLASVSLTVGVRAFTVEIDAPDGTPLRTYRRRSGKLFTSDEDPLALLEPLSMKTRAFTQSSVCALFARIGTPSAPWRLTSGKGQGQGDSRLARAYGMGITAQARSPRRCGPPADACPADVEMCCARIRAQGTRAKAARELSTRLADYDGFMLREAIGMSQVAGRRLMSNT